MKYDYLIVLAGEIVKTKDGIMMPEIYDGLYQGAKVRLDAAIKLFFQGRIERIIVVSGKVRGSREEKSKGMADYLISHKVPENSIIALPSETNTLGNARAIKKYFTDKNFRDLKIGLLTSKYHLSRATTMFHSIELSFEPIAAEPLVMDSQAIEELYNKPEVQKRLEKEKLGLIAFKRGDYWK